jgi:cytidylate kinase
MKDILKIAIDGPAGAGKSTVAKKIAEKLNINYIDTGAMYRALTLKLLMNNIDINNKASVVNILKDTSIDFNKGHIFLDNKIVDKQIRNNSINKNVSNVAKIKEVRDALVKIQREIANNKSVIMDGRDIGTIVLPDANYKFYITASVDERAKRRYKELIEKGEKNITLDKIKEEIIKRDKIDSTREFAPLVQSNDAIEIDTTNMDIDETVQFILSIINKE